MPGESPDTGLWQIKRRTPEGRLPTRGDALAFLAVKMEGRRGLVSALQGKIPALLDHLAVAEDLCADLVVVG